MRALTSLIIGSVLLVLSGCGSSSAPSNDNPDPPEVQGLLSLVDDPGAFETSLKEGLRCFVNWYREYYGEPGDAR